MTMMWMVLVLQCSPTASPAELVFTCPDGCVVQYMGSRGWERAVETMKTPPIFYPGTYQVRLLRDGNVVEEQTVTVTPGGRHVVAWKGDDEQKPIFGVEPYTPSASPTFSGHPIPVATARRMVMGDRFPDHKDKLHVTVISSDDDARKNVVARLTSFGNVVVRDYPPTAWQVKDVGFVLDGLQIYCQSPEGKVIWRTSDPDEAVAALRRADPKYNPKNDPSPGGGGGIKLDNVPKEAWPILLGFVAAWAILGRSRASATVAK